MQRERVSFQGSIPRDGGTREAGVGSRKGRKNPGKLSNLPASHSDFSDSLNRKKIYPPKGNKKNPRLVSPQEMKARLQTALSMGMR